MESQLHRDNPYVHTEPHEHGDKKSVLKKVKDKAKRIKDTITKHGHEQEPGHDPAYEEDEEEDLELETVTKDPEIHGAPVYESTVISCTDLPMQTEQNLESPANRKNSNSKPSVTERESGAQFPGIPSSDYGTKRVDRTTEGGKEEPYLKVEDERKSQPESEMAGLYTGSHDQFAPDPSAPWEQFGAPASNYETKVTDPTREGKEADVAPLLKRLDHLNVDEPESKPVSESVETAELDSSEPTSMPRDAVAGAISEKASSMKDTAPSKVGHGDDSSSATQTQKPVSELEPEYGQKDAGKLSPIYEKVVETGSGGGSEKGVSVKAYLVEKLRPGDEDKALSEAIAEALHKKKEPTPLGQVTESPEVAARLGTGKEGKREGGDAVAAGKESSGAGVVDRLKDAASLWLGKSGGTDTAQESVKGSYVSGGGR